MYRYFLSTTIFKSVFAIFGFVIRWANCGLIDNNSQHTSLGCPGTETDQLANVCHKHVYQNVFLSFDSTFIFVYKIIVNSKF